MTRSSPPQEATYRAVFETCLEGFLLTTPEGAIFDANPAACRLLGRTQAELLSLNRQELVDWTDPACHVALREWLATRVFSGQVRWIHADGSPLPVEVSTSLFVGLDGREQAGIFFRVVPDRPGASEEPERPTVDVAAACRVVDDPVFLQDEAGRVVAANDAALDLFAVAALRPGMPLADLLQAHVLSDSEGVEFSLSRLPGFRAFGAERQSEAVVAFRPRSGGRERWVHLRARLLPAAGPGERLASTVGRDITELMLTERSRSRLAARQARLDGVVLAARELAHRLNNSLTLAVGSLDLIQFQGTVPDDALDWIAQAQIGLESAVRDIRKFQRVSRVETKETPAGPALDLDRSSEAS